MSAPPVARPLLRPLAPLYRLALEVRALRLRRGWERVERLTRPVVSIGNIAAGGAGKTPLTIALAQALARRAVTVDILSRGYGRSRTAAAQVKQVDPQGTSEEFGDEPLLMARAAGLPVYVAARRYAAGCLAERTAAAGKALHLLDDGFQHRQLARQVDIVLVSRADLDDALLPAGNLREPVTALQRATVLAIPATEPETASALRQLGLRQPVWRIRRHMQTPELKGPAIAFCGIARPEQFFSGLEQAGMDLAVRKVYADHHRYTAAELLQLASAALTARATLVTTEKDAVRLAPLVHLLPPSVELQTAGLVAEIEDEAAALDALLGMLFQRG